ncbi:hypothetical protein [Sphingobacterium hungaricum]|uniref:hypothetical protein n=1 Tax=Sphingobacterium hungaricum TaxID=2082723 RepID=UPI0018C9912C|nr:hypothetical protein [Sphingobacterium hungaricum]
MTENNNLSSYDYQVADHLIKVSLPKGIVADHALPTFVDFHAVNVDLSKPVSEITISIEPHDEDLTNATLRSDISMTWGDRFRFYETEDTYVTQVMSESSNESWWMISSKDFSSSKIYAIRSELEGNSILGWLIMVTFAQASLLHQTILIHASVIEKDGHGYAFLGKSGTGKSTHARLWMENIENAKLLNDDNPAIRILENGEVFIYGTPWSGKTPCYKNKGVPVKAIIRLKQAPYNEMIWKTGREAIIALLPSSSSIRWNRNLFDQMLNSLEEIIKNIPVGQLSCLPDREAAVLCFNKVINLK